MFYEDSLSIQSSIFDFLSSPSVPILPIQEKPKSSNTSNIVKILSPKYSSYLSLFHLDNEEKNITEKDE